MALDKNGVAFTLVSLLTATTILTVTFIGDSTPADSYLDSLEIRRDTTDSTTSSINEFFSYHIERVLKQNLETISNATKGTGSLYDHAGIPGEATTTTVMSNCFIHGEFTDPNNTVEDCYPLRNETRKLQLFADNYTQTDIDINTKDITFTQSDAEHLTVETTVGIDAEDFTAETYTSSRQSYNVSLIGIPDAMYLFESNPAKRPYQPNITFEESLRAWGTRSLDRAITNHWYFHWDQAPSYYQRLSNDTTKSSECCGLASVVRPQNVTNPNNYSHLDYQYWNDKCGTNTKRITFTGVSNSVQAKFDADPTVKAIEGAILPKAFLNAAGINDSTVWEDVNCTS